MTNYTKTTDFAAKDALPSGNSAKIVKGSEIDTEFNNIATASATKANKNNAALTGTTTFETISDGTIAITAFVDEDNMVSNSATLLPTQQSVKAYVDSQVTSQDLDFQADIGGALSIDLDSETLTFTGGTGVDTSGLGNAVTFAIDSTVATLTGTQTLSNKTLATPVVSGNLTTDGLIDGRDVATDGTKLDGIESGATADQTAAEIKTAYESNANTNAFTDADESKLDGIEALADVTDTANVTAAGALMDSELTNITAVKALNQGVATTNSPTFAGIDVTGTVTADGLDVEIADNQASPVTMQQGGNSYFKIVTTNSSESVQLGNSTTNPDILLGGGNVGIGTSSPSRPLTVNGNNGTGMIINDATNDKALRFRATGNAFYIEATNNAESAYANLALEGNVGIGTSSPDALLHLSANNPTFKVTDSSTSGSVLINPDYFSGGTDHIRTDTNNLAIGTDAANKYLMFKTAGQERARLDASGRLGIGTSSPGGKLSIRATSFAGSDSHFGFGANNDIYLTYGSTGNTILRTIDGSGTNDEKMRIDSSGRVLLNKTASTSSLTLESQAPSGFSIGSGFYTGSTQSTIEFKDSNTTANYKVRIGSETDDLVMFAGGSKRVTIDSAGRLGIGTSTPSVSMHAAGKIRAQKSGAASAYIQLSADELTSNYAADIFLNDTGLTFKHNSGSRGFVFDQNGTQRMTLDASGNLLVGKTSTNTLGTVGHDFGVSGYVMHTRASSNVLYLNRTTNDGNIAEFYKDNFTVGSIGTVAGRLFIGSDDTFLTFQGAADTIYPAAASGGGRDAAINLGASGTRFKDLYLSGGAYLGGTAAANKLDDYEEGTFTATLRGGTGQPATLVTATGSYVKIGRAVTYNVSFENKDTTGYSGAVSVSGFPMANNFGRHVGAAGVYSLASWTDNVAGIMNLGATSMDLMDIRSGNNWATATHNGGSTRYLWLSGTYMTTA